jgi:hypothetical protein
MRPKDVPPMSAVRSYFAPWNRDGPCITINDTVRKRARQALNRAPEPSISVLDSPSVTTTEAGGERGDDEKKGQRAQTAMPGCSQWVLAARARPSGRPFLLPKARRGVWPRIINRFPGCKTFGGMKDTHQGSMKGGARPRRYACMSSKNRLDKRDVRSSRSDGWENARWRGRDAIGWRARNTPAPQNQAKRFALSRFYCNAPA